MTNLKEKALDELVKYNAAYCEHTMHEKGACIAPGASKILDSLIDQVREETLKEAEACVPGFRVRDFDGLVPRYENGRDMWGEKFANAHNRTVDAFNDCRAQTLAALRSLTTHQDQ